MKVERALLEELSEKVFNIGYQGELNHTQVIISCPVMFRDYPDAVASMVVNPPQGDLYPVSLTRDGNDLTWDVSAADVAIPGEGILQLTFTDGEGDTAEIIKTVYGSYSVKASLVANGEAPDPVQSWLDEAGAALSTFETEIGDIRKITTATDADEGKALSPKTVVSGKVTEWEYVDLADPEDIKEAVDEWLDDHPEATTTVEDGAITEAKLNSTLKDDLAWQDDVDELKSAITQEKAPVILDTASGEIVTIPDGADGMKVETLTVAIEPNQDLHGQDAPYPPGGGKNLASSVTYSSVTSQYMGIIVADYKVESGKTYIFSFNTPNSGIEITRGNPSDMGFSSLTPYSFTCDGTRKSFYGVANTTASITGIAVVKRGSETSTTATGLMSNFMVEEVASGTTTPTPYAPYSNICPISGWSAAEVVRTGFNLFNKATITDNKYINSGGSEQPSNQMVHSDYIRVLPNTTYYTNASAVGMFYTVVLYDIYKNHIGYKAMSAPGTFDTGNASYIIVNTAKAQTSVDDCVVNISDSSKNGQYEPYSGQTKTYTFPQAAGTVYGGTLTVNADGTGKLVVDRKMITDFTGLVANGTSSTGAYRYKLEDSTLAGYGEGTAISNLLEFKAEFNGKANTFYNGTSVINIFLAQSTLETAKTFLSDNSAQVVCPLTTPVTYNLTALEVIELLKGVNNLWADCGDTTIEYPCDTKLYVDKKIMEAIANALNA